MTKPDPEDDADSMAEYGEGDTGKPIFSTQIPKRITRKENTNLIVS